MTTTTITISTPDRPTQTIRVLLPETGARLMGDLEGLRAALGKAEEITPAMLAKERVQGRWPTAFRDVLGVVWRSKETVAIEGEGHEPLGKGWIEAAGHRTVTRT